MNWISNYVRPKINSVSSLFSRREVPENLWVKCDQCGTTYEAERSTSRFCSGGCRVKANRASKAPGPGMVVRLPTRRAAKSGTTRVRVGGPLSVEKQRSQ